MSVVSNSKAKKSGLGGSGGTFAERVGSTGEDKRGKKKAKATTSSSTRGRR